MRYHLLAHNEKNFVKTGGKVEKYKTKVGSIGTANGEYFAHLHYSVSEGLSLDWLKHYTNGWSKGAVEDSYIKPDIDMSKMFPGRSMDAGNRGYGWLDWNGKGYHPGIDYNGTGGGNTDLGYEFTSPCDGTVVFSGDWGKGWGKVIVIEEVNNSNNNMAEKIYNIKSELKNVLKRLDKDFDDEKSKDHEKMAETLEQVLDDYEAGAVSLANMATEMSKLKEEVKELTQANEIQAETIEEFEAQNNTSGYELINKFELGKWLIEIKTKK